MEQKPKRRWVRFSIRTLLIGVTIFCVWLGWQAESARERIALIKLVNKTGGECYAQQYGTHWGMTYQYARPSDDPDAPSAIRRMLGDNAWENVIVPELNFHHLLDRVERAFPEAIISIQSSDGTIKMHRGMKRTSET
jgi:hypothetical protein